jgi:acylaminoacyl-peptidase
MSGGCHYYKGFVDIENLFILPVVVAVVLATASCQEKTDRFKAAVITLSIGQALFCMPMVAAFFSKYWFGKKPWEDPESGLSPLSYVIV